MSTTKPYAQSPDPEAPDPEAPDGDEPAVWTPWRVATDSGFEVAGDRGDVAVVQIDHRQFNVLQRFRFVDDDIEAELVATLTENGYDAASARQAVDEARTYVPNEDSPTDLASVPRYMRWFENPYGTHTLAALIHDELITTEINGGALGSDTLSDRFFRQMMRASGVPFIKRWIMWAAVALRTRFVAGGARRWSVIAWLVLAAAGITAAVAAVGSWIFGWGTPIDPQWLAAVALVMPLVSSRLWGKQWAASLVAAVAALWLVPAAAVAAAGYAVYRVLEWIAYRSGQR